VRRLAPDEVDDHRRWLGGSSIPRSSGGGGGICAGQAAEPQRGAAAGSRQGSAGACPDGEWQSPAEQARVPPLQCISVTPSITCARAGFCTRSGRPGRCQCPPIWMSARCRISMPQSRLHCICRQRPFGTACRSSGRHEARRSRRLTTCTSDSGCSRDRWELQALLLIAESCTLGVTTHRQVLRCALPPRLLCSLAKKRRCFCFCRAAGGAAAGVRRHLAAPGAVNAAVRRSGDLAL
jgi:hypothetical protein